ncbi:MAG: alpha/beta hydrolase [Planctomycetota bacterium]
MKARLLVSVLGVVVAVPFVMGQARSAKQSESRPTTQPVLRDASGQAAIPPWQKRQRGPFPIRWINPRDKKLPGVKHHTFHSDSMNCDVGFNIYTPPDYTTSDKRYPVIYWLHGGASGGEAVGVGHSTILHKAILQKQIQPMIMVFPNGGNGAGLYYDSVDGTIMIETALIKELIPFIDKNYRTIPSREARAIEGFSGGGFGALKFAFEYPKLFCSVVAGAPALVDWAAVSSSERHGGRERVRRMWNNDRKALESDHPSTLAKKNADVIRAKLRIRIVVGDQDTLKERFIDQARGLKGFQFHAVSFSRAREQMKP